MNREEMLNVLYGKEKKEIYQEFKKIKENIDDNDTLFKYYEDFRKMLVNDKSFIRLRGFQIICHLAKWDKEQKIDHDIILLLNVLNSEKATEVRQAIASLYVLLPYKKNLLGIISNKLKEVNYMQYKDTMQSLIKKDIEKISDEVNALLN